MPRYALALVLVLIGCSSDSSRSNPNPKSHWPITLVVPANKAVVSNNRLFMEADTLICFFDIAESTLYLNGEIWRTFKVPLQHHEPNWADTLRARYKADTLGTRAERMHRAYESVDHSQLDTTFAPRISRDRIEVRFKRGVYLTVILESDYLLKQDPNEAAESTVNLLEQSLLSPVPELIVEYPSRYYHRGGKIASELIEILTRAKKGLATQSDLETARREHVLEAVTAIQRSAGP